MNLSTTCSRSIAALSLAMVAGSFGLASRSHASATGGALAVSSLPAPPPPPGGPDDSGGMGPPGGPRGPGGGGPMMAERKLFKQFDADGDGRLDAQERRAAREFVKSQPRRGPGMGPPGGRRGGGRGPGGPGGPPGAGQGDAEPPKAGRAIAVGDVAPIAAPLYDTSVLRTIFFEFDSADWEDELADFHRSDVEVPATMIVDGTRYPGVGVQFRGASSYMMVGKGWKRSFNISIDATDPTQRLDGYKTLNLLNAHGDPSFLYTVLYSQIARSYIPAPKANLVHVVINGESWGVYTNAQQFNKEFIGENYPKAGDGKKDGSKSSRWKAPGSPNGRAGLEYLGDDLEPYQSRFELKSGDGDVAWPALVDLCRVLNETPLEELEGALKPILDVDGVLWFLAIENVLVNSDGYWVRASDYSLYRDPAGVFHIVPHDQNEAFQAGGGPPMGPRGGPGGPDGPGGPGGPPPGPGPEGGDMPRGMPGGAPGGRRASIDLDPLIGLDDASKPLRSRLLQVPALRARYLEHVRTIAETWLDWEKLGPIVAAQRALIESAIEADTRKLSTIEAFRRMTADALPVDGPAESEPGQRRRNATTLRQFAEQRRAFLLNHAEIRALPAAMTKTGGSAAP